MGNEYSRIFIAYLLEVQTNWITYEYEQYDAESAVIMCIP